jgi:hypothetical protein
MGEDTSVFDAGRFSQSLAQFSDNAFLSLVEQFRNQKVQIGEVGQCHPERISKLQIAWSLSMRNSVFAIVITFDIA